MEVLVKSFKESYEDNVSHNVNIMDQIESINIDDIVNKLKNSIHYGIGNVRDHADSLEDSAKKLIELSKQLKNQED